MCDFYSFYKPGFTALTTRQIVHLRMKLKISIVEIMIFLSFLNKKLYVLRFNYLKKMKIDFLLIHILVI
jgi:hypothetical protein